MRLYLISVATAVVFATATYAQIPNRVMGKLLMAANKSHLSTDGGTLGVDLLAHYKMNDNTNTTTVVDTKGKNGTSVRTTDIIHVNSGDPPYLNGALSFDTYQGDFITLTATNGAFDFGANNFTIAWWEYRLPEDYAQCSAMSEAEAQAAMLFGYNGGDTFEYFLVSNSARNNWAVVITCTFTSEAWVHFAMVRSGSTYTLYKNGLFADDAVSADSIPAMTANFILGQGQATYSMAGYLDDVRFYTRALTTNEVTQLAAGTEAE